MFCKGLRVKKQAAQIYIYDAVPVIDSKFDRLISFDCSSIIDENIQAAKRGGGLSDNLLGFIACLLYTSPSPRDGLLSRMPSSA